MKTNRILLYSIFIFFAFSCGNQKKIVYFNQDSSTNSTTDSIPTFYYSPIFQANDMLSIVISSSDIATVKPFNAVGKEINENSTGSSEKTGYIISKEGEIDFPILGKIKLSGLNRSEAIALIKEKLKDYIADPTVNIQLLNFKITVLGDVQRPGTFTISDERISLLEALGLAEDLNISAERRNVLLIRESMGQKQEIRIDLTSKSFLKSPFYYLKQNDIIYVQPNKFKSSSSLYGINANTWISLISLLFTSLIFILK